jgi:cob(I)alamin adenosyltransferase
MQVLMLEFLKGSCHYGELDAVRAFGEKFVMKQMGRGFVKVGAERPDPEDVEMVEQAWAEAEKSIPSGQWDLAVLDEINDAISYGMLDAATVVDASPRNRKGACYLNGSQCAPHDCRHFGIRSRKCAR